MVTSVRVFAWLAGCRVCSGGSWCSDCGSVVVMFALLVIVFLREAVGCCGRDCGGFIVSYIELLWTLHYSVPQA